MGKSRLLGSHCAPRARRDGRGEAVSHPMEDRWIKESIAADKQRDKKYLEIAEEFMSLVQEAQGNPDKIDMGRRLMLWTRKAAQ